MCLDFTTPPRDPFACGAARAQKSWSLEGLFSRLGSGALGCGHVGPWKGLFLNDATAPTAAIFFKPDEGLVSRWVRG